MSDDRAEALQTSSGAGEGIAIVLIRTLIRRKKMVAITAIAIAAAAAIAAIVCPKSYTATVVIMPPQQSTSSGASMLAQMSNAGAMASLAGGLGIKNPNDLQVALLKSATVENALIQRFQLQKRYHASRLSIARKRWEHKSAIDNGVKDGLLRLSVTDADARRASEMASGWVEEYRRLNDKLAVTEASQRKLFFEHEWSDARTELARAEDALKEVQQRTGVLEIDAQAHTLITSAAVLRAQIVSKQVEIRAMRQFAAGQNPDLHRAEEELAGMEQQLSTMDVGADRREGDLVAPKGKVTEAGLEYERALREAKYRQTIYELMARQYEIARVDEAREGNLIQIVDPPLVPDRQNLRIKLSIGLGGFFLALPLALLLARAADVVSSVMALRRQAGCWSAVILSAASSWQQPRFDREEQAVAAD